MNRFPYSSFLVVGTFALATAAFAQSGPTDNRPLPPESPRSGPPGSPVAPNPAAAPVAPAAPTTVAPEPVATQPTPAAIQPRELNFTEADADGDKKLSLTEYSNFVGSRLANRSVEPISEEMIDKFRQLDQDNDAFLSEAESRATPPPALPVPPR